MNFIDLKRVLIAAACVAAVPAMAQDKLPPPPTSTTSSASTAASPAATPPAADQPAFKPEELEQMLAPLALYPDSLLSQVFMASTYPIEVVEAERWVKANASLKGDALTKELEKKTWDPSVRSLVNFPQVLTMMSENISTTVKIGDAFIGQQKEVMDTVQKLRSKAQAQGNLKTSKEQNVKTETVEGGTQVIVIESSSPEVVYVPQYNPTVVYGSWPYPAYPPYPYYPPSYYPVATPLLSFGVGVACGAAWGYAMGNCNWGHGDVDIDINRNTNINNNIDRSKFKNTQKGVGQNGRGSFQHDPSHRQGAAYRNSATAQKVGAGNASARTSQAQSQYRGKAEAGRSDISRGGADSFKGASPSNRAGAAGATRAPSAATSDRGAFSGSGQSGAAARDSSSRGNASRSASPSTSRSAPARSSGGGSRGGGGGGRGGGGRR